MAFDITNFIAHYEAYTETARADKFEVIINLPANLNSGYGSRELALTCESAEFPGVDVTTIDYRHYGFIKRIPHHLNYTPLNLTFYCTGEMMEKKIFDTWIHQLMIPNDTGLVQYRKDASDMDNYESTIIINQYDQFGRVTYYAEAHEALPISISQLGLNWSDDSTHRLNVSFAFTKWITDADKATSSLKPRPIDSNNFLNQINKVINSGLGIRNGVLSQIGGINQKIGAVRSLGGLIKTGGSQIPSISKALSKISKFHI